MHEIVRLIQLLNLTKAELLEVAEQADLEVRPSWNKFQIAHLLAQELSTETLEQLAGDRLAAGSTSMQWIRLGPTADDDGSGSAPASRRGQGRQEVPEPDEDESPIEGLQLDEGDIKTALAKLTGVADPYGTDVRPDEVTADPKLVAVIPSENRIDLVFAYSRPVTHVIRNFEIHEVLADSFFHGVLWPEDGVLEVRGNGTEAKKVLRTWASRFAKLLGRQAYPVSVSRKNLDGLRSRLDAVLDVYKGAHDDGGIYGTQTMTRGTGCDDLSQEAQFQQDTAALDPLSADLVFQYPDIGEVRLRVSTKQGSIWCRTNVPDEVLDHIRGALMDVKANATLTP